MAAHTWTNEDLAQECSEETRHQQWDGSSGLEGRQDKRNGRELLEEKGTGSPAHSSTAAHLQLGLSSGDHSLLVVTV